MSPESHRDARHVGAAEPPPTVLVVEPDAVLRAFLCRLFERHDVEVLVAGSATQALRVLARAPESLRVVVHGVGLLHGDERRLAEQFAREGQPRPVVTFGGTLAGPAGRGRLLPAPVDGDALVRDVLRVLQAPPARA